MAAKDSLVHVEIFGQTYAVRGGEDPGYVERLAEDVDERMKEVSRTSGAVDSVRIAVLAALNLADECARLRADADDKDKKGGASSPASDDRVARLAKLLGAALGE
jgi:cell division protein ZapA